MIEDDNLQGVCSFTRITVNKKKEKKEKKERKKETW